ncbi:MAG: hypothetical protein JSS12_08685, partial [Verrucomicrobia bacterium]|nr:hypothetical protein [Verrucomicrobiota bacterium]
MDTKPFVISKPGKYCLSESIDWYPTAQQPIDYANPQAAILIDSDNVTLDLCGNTLSQNNQVVNCVGVLIKVGCKNVTVVNGVIQNFSYLGLNVQGGNENIFLGSDDNKLIVQGCGYGNVYQGVSDDLSQPIHPGGVLIGDSFFFSGYHVLPVKTVRATNLLVQKNGNVGISVGVSSDVVFTNCESSRNFDDRLNSPGGPTILIAFASASFESADPVPSNSLTLENCHFDENIAAPAPGSAFASFFYGVAITTNVEGIVIRNCTVNNNSATGSFADFFLNRSCGILILGNSSALIEGCTVSDNFSDAGLQGIRVSGFDNV